MNNVFSVGILIGAVSLAAGITMIITTTSYGLGLMSVIFGILMLVVSDRKI